MRRSPVRADIGAQLDLSYQPAPGFELSGSLRKKVLGNLDTATRAVSAKRVGSLVVLVRQ